MQMFGRLFLSVVLGGLVFAVLVQAQDQSGFISLDCGLSENSHYTDAIRGINYISDADFIDTGNGSSILPEFQKDAEQQLWHVRSFPEGIRNCYRFNLTKGNTYLIRTTFMYGNYDVQGIFPVFDMHIGPNKWATIKAQNVSLLVIRELVHVLPSSSLQVCLVNTDSETPFISTLEIRPLASTMYKTQSASMNLFTRLDVASTSKQTISVSGNPNLCAAVSCENKKKKKSNVVVPVVASVAGSVELIAAALVIFLILKRRTKDGKVQTELVSNVNHIESFKLNNRQYEARNRDFETKNRQFSYSDIVKMTDNFNKTLGEGGFGTVYYGRLDQMEVAVKMLSQSSAQGFQQFEAEVQLFMRVHHRNLVSLVGYCDEDNKMALVYEYMAKGNLKERLSDSSANVLSWEGRLRIAVEAAQGDVRKIVDQRLQGDVYTNSVWKAVEIAMACLSATANRRPTMNVVVIELNECLAIETARIKSASTGFDSKDSIDHMISLNLGTELNPRASLDCGLPKNSSYTDVIRGINYISDADFIDTGTSNSILPEFQKNAEQQLWHVRSFPEGTRNCYRFNLTEGNKYLIRTTFMYGNYDEQVVIPSFDLHIGPNKWVTVKVQNVSLVVIRELVHVMPSSSLQVCLVNTDSGTPFISALEIRPLTSSIYKTQSGSLNLFTRLNVGSTSNSTIRYADDVYDRLWFPDSFGWAELSTSLPVDSITNNGYKPPSVVMQTAGTSENASKSLDFYLEIDDTTLQFYAYFHFAEIQKLKANESREFNISFNKVHWYGPFSPTYLSTTTVYSPTVLSGGNYSFSILKTGRSTLPPILNALEIYSLSEFLQSETDKKDVDAITNIKLNYGVKKISWQGDPCAPKDYMWEGLNCSFDGSSPGITSLNLSSSGLKGEISPYLSNLTLLGVLDLSNNNLTGPVPDFLTQLPLTFLKLDGNNLTGSIPVALLDRSNNGSLSLSTIGNPNLCAAVSCKNNIKKKSNIVVVVASVAGSILLIAAALAIFLILKRRPKDGKVGTELVSNVSHIEPSESNKRQYEARKRDFETKNRQFSYSDILKITDNFNKTLGKGGFGTVYYGTCDQMEVAVKILSKLSAQGFQQFEAEVELLMRVHHRNLVSLVGYCDEDNEMALVYEYMENGDLREHLSDSSANVLSWEGRLRIAVEAAQGLECLHNGCKPPIIHRDVKSTNILLNENFQAKLADFGLSKSFPTDNNTHVSTVVAGTPGYLDPEYYISNRLTEKSDVFSFGVVLLEIITCRTAITRTSEYQKTHLSQWVDSLISQGDVRKIVDQRLQGDFDMNSVWKAVEIAMACLSAAANARPTMNVVVMELNECLATELARIKSVSTGFDSKDSIDRMISMNLGAELNPKASYTDKKIHISDADFIGTGTGNIILPEFQKDAEQQLWHVRSFPEGTRNCYSFNLTKGNTYLIRATFMYGNYDEQASLKKPDKGMEKFESFLYSLLGVFALIVLVHAQDQTGFISIDCGAETSSYTGETGLTYVWDANFIDTGINKNVTVGYQTESQRQNLWNLRSFPEGIRNCYNVKVKSGTRYLIRASFLYGNYDLQTKVPEFDLHLGANMWDSVKLGNESTIITKEIIHSPSSNYTYVCLVNTGFGTPFISALEFRPLKNTTYTTEYGSLILFARLGVYSSANPIIRFPDDVYDRIWFPYSFSKWDQINTSLSINSNDFRIPQILMMSAATPNNASQPLNFSIDTKDTASKLYVYLHFAELEVLLPNQSRQFNISINGRFLYGPVVPNYLAATTAYSTSVLSGEQGRYEFSIFKSEKSTLPPILNAVEFYIVKQLLQSETDQIDVDAIKNIKSMYKRENWQGDPCAPKSYVWDGLNCSYDDFNPPRIISLDLSNNNLTGTVPQFLSQLKFLSVLNLTGNNLTGSVPIELIERSKKGSLSLSVDGNPNLCSSCNMMKKKKKKTVIVPIVASVASVFILISLSVFFWKHKGIRIKQAGKKDANFCMTDPKTPNIGALKLKNPRFTYAEIVKMTNNFEMLLGEGSFGKVFHGYLDDDTEVAVKMLSESSQQGYDQFEAEVKLLLTVHHRNLTELYGYCDEGNHVGLIYECMANGNLKEHLRAESNEDVLSWEGRLRIAVEYFESNRLTAKSDVYSFGVVLLEIITNRSVITNTNENSHIKQWVGFMLAQGDIKNIVDQRLHGDFDSNSAWKIVELAMHCVSQTSIRRPTMSHVVIVLKDCLAMEMARTNGHGNEPKDQHEMFSVNMNSELAPTAR
ncbi:hypothetical protein LWI29_029978 [Acer saccharum]|uniref:non-specific serine/threonine protein kinase n=1 Tax=Acer saccharum TaxID=4024 RepID=A0AA39W0T7_ACESA|nr:hypothetical protein LWI29_029978 [Acer saccharum]